MKLISNYLLIALAFISVLSCSDNLDDDNTPALQAVRNGELFKSTNMSATANADGSLTLVGQNPLETVVFNLENDGVGTYRLGSGSASEVVYTFNGAEQFSTSVGNGTGEVRLTSVDAVSGVTGTFSFVSYLANNADSLYMRRGVIFQVPFGSAIDTGNSGGNTSNQFRANIDGTALNPTLINGVESSGILLITGSNGSNSIVLSIPSDIVPGTYALDSSGTYIASYIAGSNLSSAVSGELIITAADAMANTVTGTFNFMTGPPNNFEITNGSFNINY